jgi:hypothetical protein
MRLIHFLGLIGAAIFVWIIYSIGASQIIESVSMLDPFLFSIALLFFVPIIALKAAKQAMLVNALAGHLSFFDSARIWLIGFFFSTISPGRSGDLLKSTYFVEKAGLQLGRGLTAVVVERFLDLVVLFLFGLFGFFVVSLYFILETSFLVPLLFAFVLFLAAAFAFTKKRIVLFFLLPFYRLFVPKKLKGKAQLGFHDFFEGIAVYRRRKMFLLKITGLTALIWFIGITQYYFITLSLHMNVPFYYLFAMMPIIELLTILPIAFSGLGTREAGLVFFLGLIGISAKTAVGFSLLILLTALLLACCGLACMRSEKKAKLRDKKAKFGGKKQSLALDF